MSDLEDIDWNNINSSYNNPYTFPSIVVRPYNSCLKAIISLVRKQQKSSAKNNMKLIKFTLTSNSKTSSNGYKETDQLS